MSADLADWSEFNTAMAAATAALAGLIIVAMSVNIERILETQGASSRGASAVGSLTLALIACCLSLVPGQPLWALGVEILVGAACVAAVSAAAVNHIWSDRTQPAKLKPYKSALAIVPTMLFVVGGIILAAGSASGYPWVAAGCVFSILAGVAFSWVALVEMLR